MMIGRQSVSRNGRIERLCPSPFRLAIRYQDLVVDPASRLDRIVAFLDLHVGREQRINTSGGVDRVPFHSERLRCPVYDGGTAYR